MAMSWLVKTFPESRAHRILSTMLDSRLDRPHSYSSRTPARALAGAYQPRHSHPSILDLTGPSDLLTFMMSLLLKLDKDNEPVSNIYLRGYEDLLTS